MYELDKFTKVLDELKDDGRYRVFNDILRTAGNFPERHRINDELNIFSIGTSDNITCIGDGYARKD